MKRFGVNSTTGALMAILLLFIPTVFAFAPAARTNTARQTLGGRGGFAPKATLASSSSTPAFSKSLSYSPLLVSSLLKNDKHNTQWKTTSSSHSSSSTSSTTSLHMSDSGGGGAGTGMERTTKKKRGVQTITKDRTELKEDMEEKKEEQWRVVLHNDEVHTFNYVVRALCKVIGTLDRKRAFDICVATHGTGKATITKTWKKQAEQYCLGLQRMGLTASIAPDSKFEGGHSGGGY